MVRRYRDILFDRQRDICDRTYVLFVLMGGLLFLFLIVFNLCLGVLTFGAGVIYSASAGILLLLMIKSLLSARITFEPFVMSFLITLVFIPAIFLARTGYYADIPVYMIIGYALNAMILKGRNKIIFNAVYSIDIVCCYLAVYFRAVEVSRLDYETSMLKSVVAVDIAFVFVATVIVFQRWILKKERALTEGQTAEIERLGISQFSFFSAMSHEIRTPLNAVVSLSETNLKMEMPSGLTDSFIAIHSGAKRVLGMVNDILDLSKIQAGKMESVTLEYSFGAILMDYLDDTANRAHSKNIEFESLINPEIPGKLIGDGVMVGRIMGLVTTYSIGTTDNGRVSVVIDQEYSAGEDILLKIEIRDTGTGFKKENIRRAFDAFHRQRETAANREISGLELALARSFAEILGGDISLNSIYGGGSIYRITIPQRRPAAGGINILEDFYSVDSISAIKTKGVRALVADDEPLNLNVFSKLTEDTGMELTLVTSGEEALKEYALKQSAGEAFDLVFLDINMPGLSGQETLEAMKKTGNQNPSAIALTADVGEEARLGYLAQGFAGYLSKPLVTKDCLELLASLLPEDKVVSVEKDRNEIFLHSNISFGQPSKLPVVIATDSVASLPGELFDVKEVKKIPVYISLRNGKTYADWKEVTSSSAIYNLSREEMEAVSLVPPTEEYETFFRECLDIAESVIFISMARYESRGYDNAIRAAESFENVTVVDSGQMAGGQGLLVYEAWKLAKEGVSPEDIPAKLELPAKRCCFSLLIRNMDSMFRNGRTTKFWHTLVKEFGICPEISFKRSQINITGIYRGDEDKVLRAYVKRQLSVPGVSPELLMIIHTGISGESLEKIWREARKLISFKRIVAAETSASVGINAGEGAFGLCFYTDRKDTDIKVYSAPSKKREAAPVYTPPEFIDSETGFLTMKCFEHFKKDREKKNITDIRGVLIEIEDYERRMLEDAADIVRFSLPKNSIIFRYSENTFLLVFDGELTELLELVNRIENVGEEFRRYNKRPYEVEFGIRFYGDRKLYYDNDDIDLNGIRNSLETYVHNLIELRIVSVDLYEKGGIESIHRLKGECESILNEVLYPLIYSETPIRPDVLYVLHDFSVMLLDSPTDEDVDLSLMHEVSSRLLRDFGIAGDFEGQIIQAETHINACYANVYRTARVSVDKEINTFYRDDGLKAAKMALRYVDKEKFLTLSDNGKNQLLRIVKFYSALYDTFYSDEESNYLRYDSLVDSLELAEDSFYRDNIENYDWKRHTYRAMEHMGQLTERNNRWGFTREQCLNIYRWVEKRYSIFEEEGRDEKYTPASFLKLILIRNKYFAGLTSKDEYRMSLFSLYGEYRNMDYDLYSVQANLLIPTEYLGLVRDDSITGEMEAEILFMYDGVVEYIIESVNTSAFNDLQDYLVAFLELLVEIPGRISFMDMGAKCMAALHPATYIHSSRVADITVCFMKYLIANRMELISGEYPEKSAAEIMEFARNAAFFHDIGKITMIDTIFVHGRDFFEKEERIYKNHPAMGEKLLSSFESTKQYASLAKAHHVSYDGKSGYPAGAVTEYPVLKNLIAVANTIEEDSNALSITHTVEKDWDEIVGDIIRRSGRDYAPLTVELLKDRTTMEEIKSIVYR